MITRFRAYTVGIVFLVLGFCSGVQADEALETPALISPPLLPSAESFEAPKPPDLVKDAAHILPDMTYWYEERQPRSLTSPHALARMEETAFDGLDDGLNLNSVNGRVKIFFWPVRGKISSGFGWRGSGKRRTLHEGIDIPVPRGTPVRASLSGVVSEARVYNGYGKTVILDHGNGTKTLYAHCSKFAVKQGEYVKAGQVIAYAGSTGRSTTSHLHFGVIVAGVFRDPAVLLGADSPKLVRKP